VEASKPIYFLVTEKHAKHAIRKDCEACVLSNALRDQLGDLVDRVIFKNSMGFLRTGNTIRRYRLDPKLKAAIKEFDKTGVWTMPYGEKYRLSPPSPAETLAAMRARSRVSWATKPTKNPGSRRHREVTREFGVRQI
jgi:hypothetical protein